MLVNLFTVFFVCVCVLMILAFCSQSILRLKLFHVLHRALQNAAVFLTPLAEIQSVILPVHLQTSLPLAHLV